MDNGRKTDTVTAAAQERAGSGELSRHILRVERMLFDAAGNPELFVETLKEIASILTAKRTFFARYNAAGELKVIVWDSDDSKGMKRWIEEEIPGRFPCIRSYLKQKGSFLSDDVKAISEVSAEEYRALRQQGIENFMITPVKDKHGEYSGFFGAVNMETCWDSAELLEATMLIFLMALNNMESIQMIRSMGMIDRLTGLLNRNSYHKALEEYEKSEEESLVCVYVDVDGLHQMNNQCGHASGDKMLQTVAEAFKTEFGAEKTFRIGGDEFIAFSVGLSPEQVLHKIENMKQAVQQKKYHISVGVAWRTNEPLVFELVNRAEERMYEEKRLYYQQKDDEQQVRERNHQLDEILEEKRILEVFRAVLSSKYKGVYIVDLGIDTVKPIFIPPYFEEAIERAKNKFSAAMDIYRMEQVHPKYHEAFQPFLDHQLIEEQLAKGVVPELCYEKQDHTRMLLRVSKSPDYTEHCKECIWTFEQVE